MVTLYMPVVVHHRGISCKLCHTVNQAAMLWFMLAVWFIAFAMHAQRFVKFLKLPGTDRHKSDDVTISC